MPKKILAVLACVALFLTLAIPCFATGYGNLDTYYVSPVYTPTVITYSYDLTQSLSVDLPLTVPVNSAQNNTNNAWVAVYDDVADKRYTILCRNILNANKNELTTLIPSVAGASPANLLVGNSFTVKYEGVAVDPTQDYNSSFRLYVNSANSPTINVTLDYVFKSADTGELVNMSRTSSGATTTKLDPDGNRYIEISLRDTIIGLQAGGRAPIYLKNAYFTVNDTDLHNNCFRIASINSVDISGNSVAQSAWDNSLNVNYDNADISFTDWLGIALGGFFDTPLFTIGGLAISLGALLATVITLGLAIMIIRAFAGG